MFPYSSFPVVWDVNDYIKLNSKDLVLPVYKMMGSNSMNSNFIKRYFIRDGINPAVTYSNFSKSAAGLSAAASTEIFHNTDNPMRCAKFLYAINSIEQSPTTESILAVTEFPSGF